MFTAKLSRMYREFPYTLCPYTYSLPIINIPHQSGTFVTIDDPILTHHNHPKFIVYSTIHSWCFLCIGQMHNGMYPSLWYYTEYFHCPKNLPRPTYSLLTPPPPPTPGNHWVFLTVSILLPFLVCHIVGIIPYVAILDWLISLSNVSLRFFHVFSWTFRCWIILHFLDGAQFICLFTYQKTSWLLLSFCNYE